MKYSLQFLFAACCIFFLQPCFAKNNDLEKANYLYSHLAFRDAISYFEKIPDSAMPAPVTAQLADCYRLTGNTSKAAFWYAKAVSFPDCKDQVKLHYGQILMQLMQYNEAEKWLEAYLQNNPAEKRAANLLAGCKTALLPQSNEVVLTTLLGINTDRSEFAPTLWRENLVFMTDTVIAVNKKTDKWSGSASYGLYYVSADTSRNSGGDVKKITAGKDLNIKYHTGPCSFSAHGDTMYFTRSRYQRQFLNNRSAPNKDGMVQLEVMIASDYDEKEKRFNEVTPFQYNSANYSVSSAVVSPDGSKLIFSSDMPGGKGGSDLYICHNDKQGGWTNPENLGGVVNTEGEEVYPYFIDNATLSFSSDGLSGLGGLDVYTVKWDEKNHSFALPVNIGAPVNSSYDDMSLALFPGGKKGYFSSNRPAAKGGDNIYYYEKKEPAPIIEKHEPPVEIVKAPPVEKTEIEAKVELQPPFKKDTIYTINGFYFPVNRADILPEAMGELDKVSVLMQQNPRMKIKLLAYTDCRGTGTYNQHLSDKRAESIKKFLALKGIAADRLFCKGMGIEKLQCVPCNTCSAEQLHKSRRVDFVVMEQ